jgi:hypothetical protein
MARKLLSLFLLSCLLVVTASAGFARGAVSGRVVDPSGLPVAGATVVYGVVTATTDAAGSFTVTGEGERIGARAPGYARQEVPVVSPLTVTLTPLRPRALYLSHYGVGSRALRSAALRLIAETELNAVVIDVKGDAGYFNLTATSPLAARTGAERPAIRDLPAFVRELHGKGIYAIARVVVFKDHPLAMARPDLAVRRGDGSIWRDRERLAWTDPFRREVWEYNIAVAEAAARAGFDEVQFDYVRFPDARGVRFSRPATQASRVAAIGGFLAEARKRLAPYNVFLAADIFGYVCWNTNDTQIGQLLEALVPLVDYISPMLYPSGFQFGIPGFRNPIAHPYEIVSLSLARAGKRTKLSPVRFRPWLQAFRDYAFDRRPFGGDGIRAQIRAAEAFGSDGWMLWNPRNVYGGAGLKVKGER